MKIASKHLKFVIVITTLLASCHTVYRELLARQKYNTKNKDFDSKQ